MIEISRSVTIGQYIYSNSSLNRLDARVKVLGSVALIVVTSVANTFAAFGVLALFAVLLLALSRISPAYILRSLRPAFLFLLVIIPLEVLFYPAPANQADVLWSWGLLNVSVSGLVASALISLRALLLYYFVNMLTFTTSQMDIADGTEALLSPLQRIGLPVNEMVMVLVVALKFVPLFVVELERMIKARTARGVRLDTGNFISRAMKIGPLLVPLFLSGFKRAEALTVAMEARCYRGGRGRTKRRRLRFAARDALALLVLALLCGLVVYATIYFPL